MVPMVGFLAGLLGAAFVMGALLLAAGAPLYVLGLLVCGLLIGALGRFVVAGPNPMGVGTALLVGIGGSFLGGFAGWFGFGDGGWFLGLMLAVAGAAYTVWLIQRHDRTRLSSGRAGSP